MPTVLRLGSYRFFFYANDLGQPPHVHVEAGDRSAKFWLEPIRLQRSSGFRPVELQRMRRMIEQHHEHLVRSWHEYFAQ